MTRCQTPGSERDRGLRRSPCIRRAIRRHALQGEMHLQASQLAEDLEGLEAEANLEAMEVEADPADLPVDGGGGGDGGPAGTSAPAAPPGLQPGNAPALTIHSRPFEEKTARDPQCAYDGEKNGATWRSDVFDYFISKCPDVDPWLQWVEQQGAVKVTDAMIAAKALSGLSCQR